MVTPEERNPTFREREHTGWQKLAAGYDASFQKLVVQAIDPLLDAAHVSLGHTVLDLCCGPGYVAGRAFQRGASLVGVDFASSMIELARRHNPELQFQQGDAEQLGFADSTFDAVVMNFGLHHIPCLSGHWLK